LLCAVKFPLYLGVGNAVRDTGFLQAEVQTGRKAVPDRSHKESERVRSRPFPQGRGLIYREGKPLRTIEGYPETISGFFRFEINMGSGFHAVIQRGSLCPFSLIAGSDPQQRPERAETKDPYEKGMSHHTTNPPCNFSDCFLVMVRRRREVDPRRNTPLASPLFPPLRAVGLDRCAEMDQIHPRKLKKNQGANTNSLASKPRFLLNAIGLKPFQILPNRQASFSLRKCFT
jgi:hypothetical protein